MFPNAEATVPSEWVLVFDTETTVDESQKLRIGTYQVREGLNPRRIGIFYDPIEIKGAELRQLRAYANGHRLEMLTVSDFIENIFYKYGYDYRATIVGFNLPFDISRLAVDHCTVRPSGKDKSMRGGFSFKLSENPDRPRVQIKHVSSRLSFIRFTGIEGEKTIRSARKKGKKISVRRGFFIDVKTFSAALLAQAHTLRSLAKVLQTKTQKAYVDQYGGKLTAKDLTYAVLDVQVTWECYQVFLERFKMHSLTKTQPHKIYSEASLGKAYLKEMNIKSWQQLQPGFPKEIIGYIMSSYYGGRSEIHIRRRIMQVLYCDFLSMYPTVCTLMGLWQFVIANGMKVTDTTAKTRRFLNQINLNKLQEQDTWKLLHTIVQIEPSKDIFPIRAKYGTDEQYTIGVNYASSEEPLWFTLADCVGSKLLTGNTPKILKALSFMPKGQQKNLRAISIAGNQEYKVDPCAADFFARIIDLRSKVKSLMKTASSREAADLDSRQLALKILANATSYGIFMELNDQTSSTEEEIYCYGPSNKFFPLLTQKYEEPGPYFHPLLATLITGAARLMLAIAERLAFDNGLNWAFCDTDSMALAKPDNMGMREFYARAGKVRNWFRPLNPYEKKEPLFKVEDVNYRRIKGKVRDEVIQPLFCYAISAKRYALFNIDPTTNKPLMRKLSAHGLGHLINPNPKKEYATELDETSEEIERPEESKIKKWHEHFWYCILEAALSGNPDEPDYVSLKGFEKNAASRYAITTPKLEEWFKKYNADKLYCDRVRPFNFLLAFQENFASRLVGFSPIKPIAPYNTNPAEAMKLCFDRDTGEAIHANQLATYAEQLAQYHLHSESKFHNGEGNETGITQRRHIKITADARSPAIQLIGKEANKWEEQYFLGYNPEGQKEYIDIAGLKKQFIKTVQQAVKTHGLRKLARTAGMSYQQLSAIEQGIAKNPQAHTGKRLHGAIIYLDAELLAQQKLLQLAKAETDQIGTAKFAKLLDTDRTNFRKVLHGKRPLNKGMKSKLQIYFKVDDNNGSEHEAIHTPGIL